MVTDDLEPAMVDNVVEEVVESAWVVCGLVWDASVDPDEMAACVVLSLGLLAHSHNRKTAIKDMTNHFTLNKWSDAI
jgi:hypothetical protein